MKFKLAILPGDGIGPEVVEQALGVLDAVARTFGHELEAREAPIGGAGLDACGEALPSRTLDLCRAADAVLLGAVGGPRWSDPTRRPEQGLLDLRSALGLYANLRPVRVWRAAGPLRPEVVEGVDLVFVRELTGGLYFGARGRRGERAVDECAYTVAEVERVVRLAATLARARRGRLTSVDKANVLETSRLWRETAERVVGQEFPDVTLEHRLVDAMAMHLVERPGDFDVIVTENLFGDILTDLAAVVGGSIGLAPSASLGAGSASGGPRRGLYEPIHGSAPDLAGRDVANPLGAILSVALMLRHSFGLEAEARAVEAAVERVLVRGPVPADLAAAGQPRAGCSALGAAVREALTFPGRGDAGLLAPLARAQRWNH